MLNILVTGATGNIGSELTHLLSVHPDVSSVRAATRSPDGDSARLLQALASDRVVPTAFDTTNERTVQAAMDGTDVLCLITPLGDDPVSWQKTVLDAAGEAGVRRIVKVSVDAANPDAEDGPAAAHWAGEQMLRAMDVQQAIVRPTIFMQHFLIVPGVHSPGEDSFHLPIGDAKVALLDCRDIAALVAEFATCDVESLPPEPVHLTGPEALSGEDIARTLSEAAGRPIDWNADEGAFVAHSKATGSPLEVKGVYAAGAKGAFASVSAEPFEGYVGRRPASFAKFASDYRGQFQSRDG